MNTGPSIHIHDVLRLCCLQFNICISICSTALNTDSSIGYDLCYVALTLIPSLSLSLLHHSYAQWNPIPIPQAQRNLLTTPVHIAVGKVDMIC